MIRGIYLFGIAAGTAGVLFIVISIGLKIGGVI